jgi:phosphopantothenoylcysteine decarboxylase / phosphopantothenate---cysteine ligase
MKYFECDDQNRTPTVSIPSIHWKPSMSSDQVLLGKRILLGITGGVAAFKSCELVRLLTKAGARVQVVMTESATRFIAPALFQALSGRPVLSDLWDPSVPNGMAHIELTRDADLMLIAPVTAHTMGRIAQGLADDLLSTLAIARSIPLAVAPAMNREMWANAATQRNCQQLLADGVHLWGPAAGEQACGEVGDGRMLEAEQLMAEVVAFFQPKLLQGQRVLLTAGPTFEPIDPVRGITNLSSGKMGFALAQACQEAGAHVTLVAGPTALPTPWKVQRRSVQTARQMHGAVLEELPGQDIFIAVAAVADWHVANTSTSKLKKDHSGSVPALVFGENPDILAEVAKRAKAQGGQPYCVGFAAESEDLANNARKKRERKACPMLVANIGHQTFGQDDNSLLVLTASAERELPRANKISLARQLVAAIAQDLAIQRQIV